ncbi:MAG: acetyl-CoA carboxylase carboxyltransferase subunit beta, partial [Bacteroidota bacterium]|nr:acetyl-CoA carboxylase carboxyltransferase subunit beta [Bacteroidota bacterium]
MAEENTGWFSRIDKGIVTETRDKKEVKEGMWYKCPQCNKIVTTEEHEKNIGVCSACGHHSRISSVKYFELIFDDNKYTEINSEIRSSDPLGFVDRKPYVNRLKAAHEKTNLNDAVTTVYGEIDGQMTAVASMNFEFIGGSMGAVVGEKIVRLIDFCIDKKMPLIIFSKSGGARMMEAALSLMQLAKISSKLTLLAEAKLPYISFLLDPTTGGVTASYAM